MGRNARCQSPFRTDFSRGFGANRAPKYSRDYLLSDPGGEDNTASRPRSTSQQKGCEISGLGAGHK